jgi:hypothetical protein
MFKVVRRRADGSLVSCSIENPELAVEYRPGLWSEARVGGLLVFTRYALADGFACALRVHTRHDYEIWRCEGREEMPLPQFRISRTDLTEAVKMLWRAQELGEIKKLLWPRYFDLWPEGTAAYRMVKLLERVDNGG